jgi:hypothetical protein
MSYGPFMVISVTTTGIDRYSIILANKNKGMLGKVIADTLLPSPVEEWETNEIELITCFHVCVTSYVIQCNQQQVLNNLGEYSKLKSNCQHMVGILLDETQYFKFFTVHRGPGPFRP